MTANDVDVWAWRLIERFTDPEHDLDDIEATASELINSGPPLAVVAALASHTASAFRLLAQARQRPLDEVIQGYSESAQLARLAGVDLEFKDEDADD